MGTPPPAQPPGTPPETSDPSDPGILPQRAADVPTTVDAVASALDRLVLTQVLTAEQAQAVTQELLAAPSAPGPTASPPPTTEGTPPGGRSWAAVLGEVGGYIGAAFVLGGCVVIASTGWDTLSRPNRMLLLAGPAVLMLLAAAAVAGTTPGGWSVHPRRADHPRGTDHPRRRLVATLAVTAAVLTAAAVGQVVEGDDQALAMFAAATLVCASAYAACRANLLHVASGIAFTAAAAELASRTAGPDHGEAVAWTIVAAGLVWVGLAAARALTERTLGYVFGAGVIYVGGELLALEGEQPLGYVVLALVAVAGLAGYLRTRQVPVLVVGVVALATVVPQAVDHFAGDSLRTGGALLVAGLSIIGASLLGLLLHRRTPTHRAAPTRVEPQ